MIRVRSPRDWTRGHQTHIRGIKWILGCLNTNSIPRHETLPSESQWAASLQEFQDSKHPDCVNNCHSVMQPELVSLPACLNRSTAFVVFALAIFMIAAHTGIAAVVAQRTSLSAKAKTIIPFLIAAFLASWLAIAILVGDGANFPIPLEARRALSGLVALIPFLIAVIALFASTSLRAINTATPSAWLIGIQTYRFAGIMFVYPFVTYGILPAGFGYPAGIGDALTGIFAPVVASMVAHNRPHAFKWAVAWNLFGTLDLIVAPATALLFQARVLNIYPLALVPLFLGPPLGILTHVLSLRNLAVTRTATRGRT
jgi:hypothetical protein